MEACRDDADEGDSETSRPERVHGNTSHDREGSAHGLEIGNGKWGNELVSLDRALTNNRSEIVVLDDRDWQVDLCQTRIRAM